MRSNNLIGTARKPRRLLRILIVEDHVDSAQIFARLLGSCGHTVYVAHTCASARAAAKLHLLDVLLCDDQLPDGDGGSLLVEFRSQIGLGQLRGAMISGYGAAVDIDRASKAGFELHLLKPIELETLFAAVELLGKSQTAPSEPS
jgi:two-component system, chemotaxis family, CheB/CheR fusion protein